MIAVLEKRDVRQPLDRRKTWTGSRRAFQGSFSNSRSCAQEAEGLD